MNQSKTITRDMSNLFEEEQKYYYKPERLNEFWSSNYIEYENSDDRNKTLSAEKYLKKTRP